MQVEHVQCFLLMSTFLCSVNCLPQAWILVGQAVRIAQDTGLHVSRALSLTVFNANPFPSSAIAASTFDSFDSEGDP